MDCIELVNLVDGGSVTRFLSKMPSGDLNLCALAEGTFNVMYELQTFPYDHQSLSVQVRSSTTTLLARLPRARARARRGAEARGPEAIGLEQRGR